MRLVSIVGVNHLIQPNILDVGDKVILVKEPENAYDLEAVKVLFSDKHVGYVANSIKTVMRGCCSAGNILDRIGVGGKNAEIILKYENGLIALLDK